MSRGEHPLDEMRRTGKRPPALITSSLEERRARCEWCDGPMPKKPRPGHRFCKTLCRQSGNRFRVVFAAGTTSRPMRFAYADPPYPGLARKYYGCKEVDHAALVIQLVRDFPDGWALSTSEKALRYVLSLIPLGLEVRVCVWDRVKSRPGVSFKSRNRWEPLIVCGGRARRRERDEVLDDVLTWGSRQSSHKGALVGMKPAAFCEWMFRQLGAARGDEMVDLFHGSGAVKRAWQMYTTPPDAVSSSRRRRPSRYEGSARAAGERDVRR